LKLEATGTYTILSTTNEKLINALGLVENSTSSDNWERLNLSGVNSLFVGFENSLTENV